MQEHDPSGGVLVLVLVMDRSGPLQLQLQLQLEDIGVSSRLQPLSPN